MRFISHCCDRNNCNKKPMITFHTSAIIKLRQGSLQAVQNMKCPGLSVVCLFYCVVVVVWGLCWVCYITTDPHLWLNKAKWSMYSEWRASRQLLLPLQRPALESTRLQHNGIVYNQKASYYNVLEWVCQRRSHVWMNCTEVLMKEEMTKCCSVKYY